MHSESICNHSVTARTTILKSTGLYVIISARGENMKTALIGMSGGVDSSVAAYLLQQAGYRCIGAMMRLSPTPCNNTSTETDAASVADRLNMDFHVLDFQTAFRHFVMDPFVRDYETGLTPNPCIECNRNLKFSLFLDAALKMGCDHIATGHYATVRQDESTGRYLLCKAADEAKDQSYFLYGITQQQLSKVLFPLGNLSKEQVRQIAAEQGFLNAHKRDSQDICFIPDGNYRTFMEEYTGKVYPPGQYLDLEGNPVGTHSGAVAYTIGQRKGLGIALGQPVYVCGKDMAANTVIVGPNEALFHTSLLANNWNWLSIPAPSAPLHVKAKARSRMSEQTATAYPQADGKVKVIFDTPQRAITPGQAVVLYDGDVVLGGGTIEKILQEEQNP